MQGENIVTDKDSHRKQNRSVDRRRRIKHMKTIIVIIVTIMLILPTLFCIILGLQVGQLQKQVDDLVRIHSSNDTFTKEAPEDGVVYAYTAEISGGDRNSEDTEPSGDITDRKYETVITDNNLDIADSKIEIPYNKIEVPYNKIVIPNNKSEIPYNKIVIPNSNSEIPNNNSEIPDNKSEIPDNNSEIPNNKSEISNSKSETLDIKNKIPVNKDEIPDAKDEISDALSVEDESIKLSSVGEGIYAGKTVYLTFDDGPSPITDEILDILAEYNVKATFFVIGKTDKVSKKRYQRIVDEGHTLGMHSYSHKYSQIYNSLEDFDKDFTKLWKLLYDITGYMPTIYRFPGGSANKVNKNGMEDFIRYLRDKSIIYYDWNALNEDATGKEYTEEQLIDNVLKGVALRTRSIVLMHDSEDKQKTLNSLPKLLEILISEDAEVLPLNEEVAPIQQIRADSIN
ncbi:MAG TPA: polysaccharide deacetylase family protein [Mobilitalea sp.]|nr:polysaccharide deacetylase family protein [Mobilitalea sp.]